MGPAARGRVGLPVSLPTFLMLIPLPWVIAPCAPWPMGPRVDPAPETRRTGWPAQGRGISHGELGAIQPWPRHSRLLVDTMRVSGFATAQVQGQNKETALPSFLPGELAPSQRALPSTQQLSREPLQWASVTFSPAVSCLRLSFCFSRCASSGFPSPSLHNPSHLSPPSVPLSLGSLWAPLMTAVLFGSHFQCPPHLSLLLFLSSVFLIVSLSLSFLSPQGGFSFETLLIRSLFP